MELNWGESSRPEGSPREQQPPRDFNFTGELRPAVPAVPVAETWSSLEADPECQAAWPKSENLIHVFPPYLCGAVVKAGQNAAVLASYRGDPARSCLIIDIAAKETQYLAKEIFNVDIRQFGSQRRLYYQHGPSVEIRGSFDLMGIAPDMIEKWLGHSVFVAFRHNEIRLKEISMGEILSEAAFLTVWKDVDSPSRLTIMMDPSLLSPITLALGLTIFPSTNN